MSLTSYNNIPNNRNFYRRNLKINKEPKTSNYFVFTVYINRFLNFYKKRTEKIEGSILKSSSLPFIRYS